MQQEVYIDLYFLVNISMDLLCLMITAALLHRRVTRWRAVLAAVLGGGYAVAALLLALDGVAGFLFDVLAAVCMCFVTFFVKKNKPWHLIKSVPVLMLVSMMLGGIMTALYSMLNRLHLPFETLQGDGLSVWTFALLTAVASFATVRGGRMFGLSQKTKSVTVTAVLFGKTVVLSAMVDTGNLLRDPVSGKSVIVADLAKLSAILPPALFRAYDGGDLTAWLSTYEHAKLARPIPAQTANGGGMLLALVPDSLTVNDGRSSYPADYLIAPSRLGSSAQGFDAVIGVN